MGTAVVITGTDGRRRQAKVMDSRGTAANPLSLDELYGKAEGLVRGIQPAIDLGAARDRLWGETGGADMARLFAA